MGKPFDITYVFLQLPKLISSLNITLVIVVLSILLGFIFGIVSALPRIYNISVLKRLSQVYISFFRGTPILIQLFLIYYGLPELFLLIHISISKAPVLVFVVLTYALNSGAFFSEAIRTAILSVEKGQLEAAYSIGMTGWQVFRRIIIPQALSIAIPVFANLVIANLKDTSLAFTLGVVELTGKAQTLAQITQHFIETYIALALIYLAISLLLENLFAISERYFRRFEGKFEAGKTLLGRKPRWGYLLPSGIRLQKGGARL
ncbi:amino acid ABC transporter permease [Bacillus sp. BRMEA1]|uniref:amino acid ABC transporter permease n=1 Tax=Neobacillus endophyticus TaxID=2738405 RepID=UPI0015656D0F|nr:amino acid ABC transporter permease [Neobacillus endophyticus]NRD79734.1 amino acid ABC transporter permease [Neobacillus endophyticus]